MHRIARATLTAFAPYSQSRIHEIPKLPKEGADAYEQRTWREKCHATESGEICIPQMSFKQSVDSAAKYLSISVPGKGKATYTKNFTSGCLVLEPVNLGISKDDVAMDRIYANANGIRGSGKRVWRLFPRIDKWKADVEFHV